MREQKRAKFLVLKDYPGEGLVIMKESDDKRDAQVSFTQLNSGFEEVLLVEVHATNRNISLVDPNTQ